MQESSKTSVRVQSNTYIKGNYFIWIWPKRTLPNDYQHNEQQQLWLYGGHKFERREIRERLNLQLPKLVLTDIIKVESFRT